MTAVVTRGPAGETARLLFGYGHWCRAEELTNEGDAMTMDQPAADAQRSPDARRGGWARRSQFWIGEERAADGSTQLAVRGDLDLASAPRLEARLAELAGAGTTVRLDVSGLEFVDSSGVRVLVNAVREAREGSWRLLIAGEPAAQVKRIFELVGFDHSAAPGAMG
jgi:anti-sigma B factor antagonist